MKKYNKIAIAVLSATLAVSACALPVAFADEADPIAPVAAEAAVRSEEPDLE